MIAFLEHQRIGKRPAASLAERGRVQSWRTRPELPHATRESWRTTSARTPVSRRPSALPVVRRGSARLDDLMRRQVPVRNPSGAAGRRRRRRRSGAARRGEPQARVRVARKGVLSIALVAAASEARGYLRENARLLIGIAAGSVAILLCIAMFARLPQSRRALAIDLSATSSVEGMLLEGRLPEPPAGSNALDETVLRILRVRQHEVKAGETLSEIAARYDLRLGTIINFNRITDVRSIPAGKKLTIPNADGLLYRVSRGDSLAKIAKRYGVSLNALRDWNDLQSDLIKPGQELFVPGASLSEEEINAVLGKLFIFPTRGDLTSPFGMRLSPIVNQWIFHNGIDLHNRTGTPVVAARAGRVVNVEIHAVYGKVVMIGHSGGYQTMYAHLDTILVGTGQSVSQGEQIGTMGSTGSTTGPHLHFSVFKNLEPVDPLKLLH